LIVSCLFVSKDGVYPTLTDTDCWDLSRDARKYGDINPVVAHPPCNLWVNFAALNYKRYGGEHNRPGNDGGCFHSALHNVRRCGGVLEHPAFSNAWKHFSLLRPSTGWTQASSNEWVCEVWQSAYGHKARKRTWLLYVGNRPPIECNWSRDPGTHPIGWFDREKQTLSKSEAIHTPIQFAEFLVSLARNSK